MTSSDQQVQEFDAAQRSRLVRAALALLVVVLFGTGGFALVQDEWDVWKSLYFTLITITTVGYGDYGLTPAGERFATVLLIVGIATATYAFGQFVQAAISYQLAWRHRVQKNIDHLRDHFIICGLGRVGKTVCQRLAASSMPFVVIDKNADRFSWARDHGYLALNGSGTEDEYLIKAGIKFARGVVCATGTDSANIVTTLSARELNPDLVIVSRADDHDAVRKFERAGASSVVAPSLTGGNDIADLLIRPHLAEFLKQSHRVESGYRLSEVTIDAHSELVGRTLREYGLTQQSLVFVAINRPGRGTQVRPGADEAFQAGDVVIIVGEPDAVLEMCDHARASMMAAAT